MDLLTAGTICVAGNIVKLGQSTYLGWIVMAIQLAFISILICIGMALIFYRKPIMEIILRIIGKWIHK